MIKNEKESEIENNKSSHWPQNIFCSFKYKEALNEWSSFKSWKIKNPNWNIRFYDDHNMINYVRENINEDQFKAFMKIERMASKVDIWRLIILINEGGLYTDLDVKCLKPIDSWVENPNSEILLCVDNNPPNNFGQHLLLAKPNNRILKSALNLALSRIADPQFKKLENFARVLKTTGPISFTDACFESILGRKRNNIDDIRNEEKIDVKLFQMHGKESISILDFHESENVLFCHAREEKDDIYSKYKVSHWNDKLSINRLIYTFKKRLKKMLRSRKA